MGIYIYIYIYKYGVCGPPKGRVCQVSIGFGGRPTVPVYVYIYIYIYMYMSLYHQHYYVKY